MLRTRDLFAATIGGTVLLAALSYASSAHAQFGGPAPFTARPALPPVTTIDAFSLPADEQGREPFVLRVYRLQEDAVPAEITETIQELIEPNSWKSQERVYLKSFQQSLLIRHRASTHRRVQQLLRALGAIDLPAGNAGNAGNTINYSVIPVVGDK